MVDTQNSRSGRAKRPRRRSRKNDGPSAVQTLKQAAPAPVGGPVEAPLSDDEVQRLKQTFRFLHEQRNTLKLRVNAAEDLLLNGKRDPTHRGICQHLLAKVDRSKVLQASERLPAPEATRLLAGIIRFAPELPYIMRFLECVKESAGQEQAAAALTQALGGVNFDEASNAQIRKILELIVDIFPEHEQPVFLLSLLRGAAFRKAFDRSSEGLPASLALILNPLRAVHHLLANNERGRRQRRKQTRADPVLLQEGALLLMRVNQKSLLEFNEPVRRRLFQLLCELSGTKENLPREALLSLFRSLKFSKPSEKVQSTGAFVGLLLRSGLEKDAKALLRKELDAEANRQKKSGKNASSSSHELTALLALFEEARIGPIAVFSPRENSEKTGKKMRPILPKPGQFYPGMHMHSQTKVRVKWFDGDKREALAASIKLWRSTLIPQVLLPIDADFSNSAAPPYVAVQQLESSFQRRLEEANEDQCHVFLLDLCRLYSSLAGSQMSLPDGNLGRFAVEKMGNVWLADLSDVALSSVATSDNARTLRESILEMKDVSRAFSLSEDEQAELKLCKTPLKIAELLDFLPNF